MEYESLCHHNGHNLVAILLSLDIEWNANR